jgi:DNA-binding response OmpR family regulator
MRKGGGMALRMVLIEDETKLAKSLERQLTRQGFDVQIASDAEEGERHAVRPDVHFIIMDVNLPKMSGFELLEKIRAQGVTTPVLILSARDAVTDRIKGLQLGADDYLTKPFDSGELLARIQAILQRSGRVTSNLLTAADLVVDLESQKVTRAGREISLTPKEFSLLVFFLRNKNQLLTRRRIAEQVWGYTFDTGTNIVEVYVSYLRKAVDTGFPNKLIHTVRGEGFMLVDK